MLTIFILFNLPKTLQKRAHLMYTVLCYCVFMKSHVFISFLSLADQVLIVLFIISLYHKQEIKAIVSLCRLYRGQKLWDQSSEKAQSVLILNNNGFENIGIVFLFFNYYDQKHLFSLILFHARLLRTF